VVAFLVSAALFALTVVVDEFGRLFVDTNYHTDSFLFGGLLGAFLITGSVVAATEITLPGGWTLHGPHDERKP
jgi:uncharacterized membrane protein YdcZ (DUF606 family)